MTEKRFKADNFSYEIWDNDFLLLSFDQVVDLLNELYEENEQLRKEIEDLNWELSEIKKSEYDSYNITDGLW